VIFLDLKWNVSELNKLSRRGLSFDETVNVDKITELNDEIRDVTAVQVIGRADFGSNKVTFHLNIKGNMILPCSRTLVDVNFPFNIDTNETFALSGESTEGADEELHYPSKEIVDLMPLIRENILLEVPMQIFSESNEVKPKAPQSGEGWEVITEDNQQQKVDPRLEKLKDFFDEKKK
jgi:uncharacterized protein